MIQYSDSGWFSIVAASPYPESGELLNVALLVGQDDRWRLDFVPGLPRLACLGSRSTVSLYSAILQSVEADLARGSSLPEVRAALGPHFRLSEPRQLYRSVDREILALLKNEYLGVDQQQEQALQRAASRGALAKLDRIINHSIPAFGVTVERRITPESMFPEVASRIFRSPVPPLDRAVRSAHRDVLIGSVAIISIRSIDSVRNKSARISQAFWQYAQAEQAILELTGREIRRVGVIMNGNSDPALRDTHAFVHHLLEVEADRVIEVTDTSARQLTSELAWTVEGQLPP